MLPSERERLARLARYATRPPLAQERARIGDAHTCRLAIPPDPRTGATELVLDVLELIHRLTQQIPDPGQHLVRSYGAYANRIRRQYGADAGQPGVAQPDVAPAAPTDDESPFQRQQRKSWARLLRKIFEVDPLLCPRCRVEMTIVSVITDPVPVDAILRHLEKGSTTNPHEPRAPPAA